MGQIVLIGTTCPMQVVPISAGRFLAMGPNHWNGVHFALLRTFAALLQAAVALRARHASHVREDQSWQDNTDCNAPSKAARQTDRNPVKPVARACVRTLPSGRRPTAGARSPSHLIIHHRHAAEVLLQHHLERQQHGHRVRHRPRRPPQQPQVLQRPAQQVPHNLRVRGQQLEDLVDADHPEDVGALGGWGAAGAVRLQDAHGRGPHRIGAEQREVRGQGGPRPLGDGREEALQDRRCRVFNSGGGGGQ